MRPKSNKRQASIFSLWQYPVLKVNGNSWRFGLVVTRWLRLVALRQTRLVLGWVTVCGRVNHNNNNKHDNVYGAVIMAEPLREFTRFI